MPMPSAQIKHLEPLAKLARRVEFFILMANEARRSRSVRARCFRDEAPHESGREHASARLAIKYLEPHSRLSFSDVAGRGRATHRQAETGRRRSRCGAHRGLCPHVAWSAG